MRFLDELEWRGQLYQTTRPDEAAKHLAAAGRVGYAGFDPTSDSLTIGNLIPLILLRRWQQCGHTPIVLMGGGTGLVGDPSGRDDERQLASREDVLARVESQRRIMEKYLDFDPARPNAARIVNNLDWLDKIGFLDMLRDVGKHFSVNEMIQRDSVRKRLEEREHGISFTEFSYMLLQAYDFLHLYETANCTVQLAGSDQYGNIVAGIDLIRRKHGHEGAEAFGVTAPLVTRSDGKKMGKSAGGAIWLSTDTADRTSPYAFYQYWINLPDEDAVPWLKWYTELDQDAIAQIAADHEKEPHRRIAQNALAETMTRFVHGEEQLTRVQAASSALFTGDVRDLDADLLDEVFADVPSSTHGKAELEGEGVSLVELLPQTSLASSKREAREFLGNGAVAVNGERVDLESSLTSGDLLHGRMILLRRGKKKWHATRWE